MSNILIMLIFGGGLLLFIWWLIRATNKAAVKEGFNLK